jgi:hypothetical protein
MDWAFRDHMRRPEGRRPWTIVARSAPLVLVSGLLLVGCSDDSPASPSAAQVNLVGRWDGTLTTSTVDRSTGARSSNVCNQAWVIASADGGAFAGTFQTSGGTAAPCAQAGTVSGQIASSGAISSLSFTATIGGALPAGCTKLSGNGVFTGSGSAATITALTTDRIQCVSGQTVLFDIDRSLSIVMNKQH